MDSQTRKGLLQWRGLRGRRVSQIGANRWVAEQRIAGKWRTLRDKQQQFRIFATLDEALAASEADRLEWEVLEQRLEDE
ncbi:MAG: hypothetical protein JO202_07095 [Ktedonobacteraceae bacterium]|nr:hypothetical protein [Ktedonobacteraceae bacterium]